MSAILHSTDYPALPDTDYRLYEAGNRDGYGEAFDADQMRAYVDADRAARWQPIETAPKDGTAVLVYQKIDGAHWLITPAYFAGGHWLIVCFHDGNVEYEIAPSLWQPIPLPPAPNQGEAS